MGEQVVGHYLASTAGWQPALQQSTELFRTLVADDVAAFEAALGSADPDRWHTVLWWSGSDSKEPGASPRVEAKSRVLAMLAIQHNALRVLALLLSKGANPRVRTKDGDGLSCYEVSGRRGVCVACTGLPGQHVHAGWHAPCMAACSRCSAFARHQKLPRRLDAPLCSACLPHAHLLTQPIHPRPPRAARSSSTANMPTQPPYAPCWTRLRATGASRAAAAVVIDAIAAPSSTLRPPAGARQQDTGRLQTWTRRQPARCALLATARRPLVLFAAGAGGWAG